MQEGSGDQRKGRPYPWIAPVEPSTALLSRPHLEASEQLAHCNKLINSDNISKMSSGDTETPVSINRQKSKSFS